MFYLKYLDGELLATGDKGGRVVIFQRDQSVSFIFLPTLGLFWLYVIPAMRSYMWIVSEI